jgi:hypothetical protein
VGSFATAQLLGSPAPVDIALNPTTNHILVVKPCSATICPEAAVSSEDRVLEFDTGGTLLQTHAANAGVTNARGLAVTAGSGSIYLSSVTEATGVYNSDVFILNTIVSPTVAVTATTGVTSGEAVLHGTVNPNETLPNGVETEYQFEYSINGTTWVKAAATPGEVAASTSPVAVSQTVTGLSSHTLYHVRLKAEKQFAAGNATSTAGELTTESTRPSVSGLSVTNVETDSALLEAQVNPQGKETTYRVEYGTSPAYGATLPESAAEGDLGSGVVGVGVSVHPEGLIPDTLYYYRVLATNTLGTGEATGTFTTNPATLPGALTGGASNIAQNTATISGVLDTEGQATTYGFEIGTSAGDYGPPTGLGAVGAGASETVVSLSLSGLLPGTTYHYRVTASNVNGTTAGADQTFTTASFGNVFATPPAPLPFVSDPQIAFPAGETGVVTKATTKKLTRAQKLKAALKVCKRDKVKDKRMSCEKAARKKYAPVKKATKKKH